MSDNLKKKQMKQLRIEERKKSEKRKKQIRNIAWIVTSLLLVGAIIFIIIENKKPLPGEKVVEMADQAHIEDIESSHKTYNSDPPTSGPHVENIADWGVHKEPVAKEVLVHNLEDGGVVIYYNNKTPKETIDKLEKLVEGYSDRVLVNPYPEMENMITLTAWGRMDRHDQFDKKKINHFIQSFRNIDHH